MPRPRLYGVALHLAVAHLEHVGTVAYAAHGALRDNGLGGGLIAAFLRVGSSFRNATFTPMSGRIRVKLVEEIRTFTVAFWRSAVGIIVRTLLGSASPGRRRGWT